MQHKPSPTRVNREFIRGPIYHFDRISDDQAGALGFKQLPTSAYGNIVKLDGAVARRLRDGSLNVSIVSTSNLLRDDRFDGFMKLIVQPSSISDDEDDRMPSQILPPGDGLRSGTWQIDLSTQIVTWSCMTRRPGDSFESDSGSLPIDMLFSRVDPTQRDALRAKMLFSVMSGKPLDLSYKIDLPGGTRLMRMVGAHDRCKETGRMTMSGTVFEVALLPTHWHHMLANPPYQAQAN